MSDTIKVTYDGVEITYVEKENAWNFELRGRERNAESLAKAKEAIDKPEPDKKKPFVRIKAYYSGRWGVAFETVEVTSVADYGYSSPQVWISGKEGRQKVSLSQLYVFSAENQQKLEEYQHAEKQRSFWHQKKEEIIKSMEHVEIPK